eukprot:9711770-Karenia_brevis.AAC.1
MQTTGTETDAEMFQGLGVGAGGHAAPFPQTVYATTDSQTDYYDSGTDSDTVPSIGTQYDSSDIQHMTEAEQDQEVFWQSQRSQGRARQHFRKPTRKVRRTLRRRLFRK